MFANNFNKEVRILLFAFLFIFSPTLWADDGYFVMLFKTNNKQEAEEVSARTIEKSKIIKWYEEDLWIVAIGPVDIEKARELEINVQEKTNTKDSLIIKFPDKYVKWDSAVFNASVGVVQNTDSVGDQIKALRKERAEEEKRQQWLASPEYKKQQEVLERKRIAQEKKEEAERIELERKRIATERREEAERIKREKEDQARLAINYPYYALITCSFNNMDLGVYNCMFDRAGGTVLEIQNGSTYGMHKGNELVYGGPGKFAKGGYTINLRSNFALKIQNASKNYILGVEVRDRSTNRIVFQKKANTYDVISVRN